MTDEELVLLARQGDSVAFDELVARHQGAVYRAALASLRRPEDAEEAAQDAFLRAWRGLGRFRGQASFRTWVLTIAWNRALAKRRSVLNWYRQRSELKEATNLKTDRAGPETLTRATELRGQIQTAIEALTPKLRDSLLLAQSGEFDYHEIADMLKIPVGTLKWRVAEARRRIRAVLSGAGYADV